MYYVQVTLYIHIYAYIYLYLCPSAQALTLSSWALIHSTGQFLVPPVCSSALFAFILLPTLHKITESSRLLIDLLTHLINSL